MKKSCFSKRSNFWKVWNFWILSCNSKISKTLTLHIWVLSALWNNNNRNARSPTKKRGIPELSKIITFNLCFERESRQIATCHVMSTMLTNLHSIVNCLLLHVTMGWNYFWNSILFMLFMFMHLKFSWNTKVVAVWRASSKQHHRFRKELPYWDNALFATRMSNSFNFTCKTFMPR